LQGDFRRRAAIASLALGAATSIAIPIAHWNASEFAGDLTRASVLAVMALTALTGVITFGVLWRGPAALAPLLAAATASGVVIAWAVAQNPHLVAPGLTIDDAAAAHATVRAFLIALPLGAAILVPSLALLYGTFARESLGPEPHLDVGDVRAAASGEEE
jgi:cytochrome d ubiquinol oxidase subunit II